MIKLFSFCHHFESIYCTTHCAKQVAEASPVKMEQGFPGLWKAITTTTAGRGLHLQEYKHQYSREVALQNLIHTLPHGVGSNAKQGPYISTGIGRSVSFASLG